MTIRNLFEDHPASVGESYMQHMRMALGFAVTLAGAALAVLVHAFLPFLFVRTGSRSIEQLYGRMVTNRVAVPRSGERDFVGRREA